MEINSDDLKNYKNYVIYKEGYRIVYFYENYHEVVKGVYAKNIKDFINYLKNDNINIKSNNIDDILTAFLDNNPKALGVAIYDINQNCIKKKLRKNVNIINNSMVYKEELIHDYNNVKATEGYRIIFFDNDNTYSVGHYSKTLEGFMTDFVEIEPIMSKDDIPKFISIEDILDRYLKMYNEIRGVALYKIDGTLMSRKDRNDVLRKA